MFVSGALLKAVCVCSDVVCVSSPLSLEQQLLQRWDGGLEVRSWSVLPHGSGLGEFTFKLLLCVLGHNWMMINVNIIY